ncbi:hypothetical protein IC582_030682 [Cucumis melo]
MMFISIYYAPLHLALGRPHTITVLALPYLLFYFFWNNHKHFFDYGSTTRNSMRNLSIQCVFLNHLIFQLFNHFILPSSMLVRLVNISMFRCNNKMLFVTSSFVETERNLRNGEKGESEEETDVEINHFRNEGTKQEQEGSTEEDTSPSLFSEEKEDPDKIDETEEIRVNGKEKTKDEFHFKRTRYQNIKRPVYETSYPPDGNKENSKLEIDKKEKSLFWFEKPLVTILFDYKRWNRPVRYIKNDKFENAVRNEMSQYFFYTCESDGKDRIVFTHPPSIATFLEMIKKKISLLTTKKLYYYQFDNPWNSLNEKKKINFQKIVITRIRLLDHGSLTLVGDVLQKRTQLCNDKTKKDYLPKIYDPLLSGPYRRRINLVLLFSMLNKSSRKNDSEKKKIWINKIHVIFFNTNYPQIEDKIESEDRRKSFNFFFDGAKESGENSIAIKEISKKVPRWSYKLITETDQLIQENDEDMPEDHQIRSRRAKNVILFNDRNKLTDRQKANEKIRNIPTNTNINYTDESEDSDQISLIRYSYQSDFRRELIKGSMRAQRRKTFIGKLFQKRVHSFLFFDRVAKSRFFDIPGLMKKLFRPWIWTNTELTISNNREETRSENMQKSRKLLKSTLEERRIEIGELWDSIRFAQVIRGSLLITQSIIRKYIVLPSLIIAKNLTRMLLFAVPDWYEDFQNWNKEIHIKCTYNGIPLSENEFPKNWLTDGIQIKILFPFRLKPWPKSRLESPDSIKKKRDFSF